MLPILDTPEFNPAAIIELVHFTEIATDYPTRMAARLAFSGAARAAANRFFKGASGTTSANFRTTDLRKGRFRLEFFTPARNAGFGKRYVQVIDSSGQVLVEFKETWGPDGWIETKWVHGAPR